jgi:hypothetical protein
MARRKTADPRRVALLDKQDRARQDFERNYARLKRAFGRMEKARQRLARLQSQLARLESEGQP